MIGHYYWFLFFDMFVFPLWGSTTYQLVHLPSRLLGLILLGVTGLATKRDAAWRPPKWRETAGFSKAKW
jgi:hypothetical protein